MSVLDSKTVRVACVFGAIGFFVFILAAFATTPDNSHVTATVGLSGLGVLLLSCLVAGLAWALTPRVDANTREEQR